MSMLVHHGLSKFTVYIVLLINSLFFVYSGSVFTRADELALHVYTSWLQLARHFLHCLVMNYRYVFEWYIDCGLTCFPSGLSLTRM